MKKNFQTQRKMFILTFIFHRATEDLKLFTLSIGWIENDETYNGRKSKKIEIYNELGLSLIQLNDADIKIEGWLQIFIAEGIKVNWLTKTPYNIRFAAMLANEYVLNVPSAYQQQPGLDFFYWTLVLTHHLFAAVHLSELTESQNTSTAASRERYICYVSKFCSQ